MKSVFRINRVRNCKIVFRSKYTKKVLDHFENPRNVGSLDDENPNVGTGLVGAPACGDVMKLQVQVDPETKKIIDAKFRVFGCASAIASSSYATELIIGKTVDEALNINNDDIAKHLALPPVKLHCSLLAEESIRQSIGAWKMKNESTQQEDAL